MKGLYLDCFAGLSGNMLLGAFLDLGVDAKRFKAMVRSLPLSDYELKIRKVCKQGLTATHVEVLLKEATQNCEKEHSHRYLKDIQELIERTTLPRAVKKRSLHIFQTLATAEGKVHGCSPEEIHFHEVGAVDSIIDIVGCAYCLHELKIEKIAASPLQTGNGFVVCEHGSMPIPAPATAELLLGKKWYAGTTGKELVTPTGAAILKALEAETGEMPANFLSYQIGLGAGTWELSFPNLLRMYLGEFKEAAVQVFLLESHMDDMNPQIYPYVMEGLLAIGCLDVWTTAIMMKKGRPGIQLSCLVTADHLEAVKKLLFKETSSIGLRIYPVDRTEAERKVSPIQTEWGVCDVKTSFYQGELCQIMPEYEHCRHLAETSGQPLKWIQQIVLEKARKEYMPMTDAVAEKAGKIKIGAVQQGFTLQAEKEIPYGVQLKYTHQGQKANINLYFGKKGLSWVIGGAESSLREELLKLCESESNGSTVENKNSEKNISSEKKAPMASKSKEVSAKKIIYQDIPGLEYVEDFDFCWIGSDESGKGDVLGPLVAAGVMVDEEAALALREIGVKDCKLLSDAQVLKLAPLIRKLRAGYFSEQMLMPRIYNQEYANMQHKGLNLNHLLAKLHGQVLEEILLGHPCRFALIDQFADEKVLSGFLLDKSRKITVIQSPKGERNVAVAAASILARESFLVSLAKLEKKFALPLPKGAGVKVNESLQTFVAKYGEKKLKEIGKLHFRTFDEFKNL